MRIRRHAEVVESQHGSVLVGVPEYAFLTPDGGRRRDPDVGIFPVDPRR